MGDAAQTAQRNIYKPIKGHNPGGTVLTPRSGSVAKAQYAPTSTK